MGWWLHLSSQPVSAVELLTSQTALIAVWDSKHGVHFYNQYDGIPSGAIHYNRVYTPADLKNGFWQETAGQLCAPNGVYLPTIFMNGLTLYQSRDGKLRLYHFHSGVLVLELDGRHLTLSREGDGRFLIAGLDRELGLCAAYADTGKLHIFQQHIRVGVYDLPMAQGVDARLAMHMPDGLGRLLISDGEAVQVIDSAGRVRDALQAHYVVGPVAISPHGNYIALGDTDDNVIRIYDTQLRPTHQKHAIDLVVDTRQVQLLASLPGRKAGLTALDISDSGVITFALGGVVCVTGIKALDAIPQPRPLF